MMLSYYVIVVWPETVRLDNLASKEKKTQMKEEKQQK